MAVHVGSQVVPACLLRRGGHCFPIEPQRLCVYRCGAGGPTRLAPPPSRMYVHVSPRELQTPARVSCGRLRLAHGHAALFPVRPSGAARLNYPHDSQTHEHSSGPTGFISESDSTAARFFSSVQSSPPRLPAARRCDMRLATRYIPDPFLKRQIPGGAPPPINGCF